jgi:hypothetical protein
VWGSGLSSDEGRLESSLIAACFSQLAAPGPASLKRRARPV